MDDADSPTVFVDRSLLIGPDGERSAEASAALEPLSQFEIRVVETDGPPTEAVSPHDWFLCPEPARGTRLPAMRTIIVGPRPSDPPGGGSGPRRRARDLRLAVLELISEQTMPGDSPHG